MQDLQLISLLSLRNFIHCLLLRDVSDEKVLAHFHAVPLSNKTCSRWNTSNEMLGEKKQTKPILSPSQDITICIIL